MTKTENEPWELYIDSSTTVLKDEDARDMSGSRISRGDSVFLAASNGRPTRSNNIGYIGWDRNYVGENSLHMIYYFDSIDNAKSYYTYIRSKVINAEIVKTIKYYPCTWVLTDDNDNNVSLS
jgi:hypothetical protein